MKLKNYLNEAKIKVSALSKQTGISYTTLNDLYKENTPLTKTSSENLYKISKALNVPMEELLSDYLIEEKLGFSIPGALTDLIKEIMKYDTDDPFGFRIEAVDNLENFSKNYCLDGILSWSQRDQILKEYS